MLDYKTQILHNTYIATEGQDKMWQRHGPGYRWVDLSEQRKAREVQRQAWLQSLNKKSKR